MSNTNYNTQEIEFNCKKTGRNYWGMRKQWQSKNKVVSEINTYQTPQEFSTKRFMLLIRVSRVTSVTVPTLVHNVSYNL